jgi:hypothetical protein
MKAGFATGFPLDSSNPAGTINSRGNAGSQVINSANFAAVTQVRTPLGPTANTPLPHRTPPPAAVYENANAACTTEKSYHEEDQNSSDNTTQRSTKSHSPGAMSEIKCGLRNENISPYKQKKIKTHQYIRYLLSPKQSPVSHIYYFFVFFFFLAGDWFGFGEAGFDCTGPAAGGGVGVLLLPPCELSSRRRVRMVEPAGVVGRAIPLC